MENPARDSPNHETHDSLALLLPYQQPVEQFFGTEVDFSNPYFELLRNPLAGELGVTTQAEVEHFIKRTLPKFKLVRNRPS